MSRPLTSQTPATMDEEQRTRRRKRVEEAVAAALEEQDDPNFVPPPPRKVVVRSSNKVIAFLGSLMSTSEPTGKITVSDKDFQFPSVIRNILDEIYFDVMKEETVLTSSVHTGLRGVVFKYAVTIIPPNSASTELLDKACAVPGVADIEIQSGGDNTIVVTHTISLDDNIKKALINERSDSLQARKLVRINENKEARARRAALEGRTVEHAPTAPADVLYDFIRDNIDLVPEEELETPCLISKRSMSVCWPLKAGATVCLKQLTTIRDEHWVESVKIGDKPKKGICLFLTVTKS